jgi:hypothetical protein
MTRIQWITLAVQPKLGQFLTRGSSGWVPIMTCKKVKITNRNYLYTEDPLDFVSYISLKQACLANNHIESTKL